MTTYVARETSNSGDPEGLRMLAEICPQCGNRTLEALTVAGDCGVIQCWGCDWTMHEGVQGCVGAGVTGGDDLLNDGI